MWNLEVTKSRNRGSLHRPCVNSMVSVASIQVSGSCWLYEFTWKGRWQTLWGPAGGYASHDAVKQKTDLLPF